MSKLGCAFNYAGSKVRHKDIIDGILPKEDSLEVLDLFYGAGSLTSTLNKTWVTTGNDLEGRLVAIHKLFRNSRLSPADLVAELITYGQGFIKSKGDKEGYLKAREVYNSMPDTLLGEVNVSKVMLLYILICSSFSNQLRWCDKGNWNIPHGLRWFNKNMQKNLLRYITDIRERDIMFSSMDFRKFELSNWDLVISDSPYLKTLAGYNENGGWTLKDSVALMSKLDKFSEGGGRFLMFEEQFSKDVENVALSTWMSKYNVTILGDSSSGSNYQRSKGKTVEVVVTNYE